MFQISTEPSSRSRCGVPLTTLFRAVTRGIIQIVGKAKLSIDWSRVATCVENPFKEFRNGATTLSEFLEHKYNVTKEVSGLIANEVCTFLEHSNTRILN